jgi:coproporphyrinogen III oxidase-like Fe-S oxidoreductase
VREWILQLKLGQVETDYFQAKFGIDPAATFAAPLERLRERGMLVVEPGRVRLTDAGLLRVDSLLPEFYDARYQNSRYT